MVDNEKENTVVASEKPTPVAPAVTDAKKSEPAPSRGFRGRSGFGSPSRGPRREPAGEYESRMLDLARVVRVSAGGKRLRFRAVVVVGNKTGKVGLGIGKGADVSQAVEKATRDAKNNTIVVAMTQGGTIPFSVEARSNSAHILLRPQTKGRGLVAGGTVRVVCELAGIKDVSSKILGRTGNKLNNATATIMALEKLKLKPGQRTEVKTELTPEIK